MPPRVRNALISAICGLILVPVVLVSSRFSAETGSAATGLTLEQRAHQPTPIPDRIILSWTGDPTRTQAVTWRTDTTVPKGTAQIALAGDGPQFAKQARDVAGKTTLLKSDLNEAHYHSAQFDELVPDTRYLYRVGDGKVWSEWIQFRTASDKPEPFTFVYFGDAQNDVKSHWSRVIREAYSEPSRIRFLIHAGDLINSGNRDAEWGEWFGAGGWVNAMVPNVPTPGNHEYPKVKGDERGLSYHWRPQFALPENGPKGLEETTYWFDFQGVRIVSLNSNEQQEVQVPWLDAVLTDNPQRWTIVTFHHPLYSAAKARDNAKLRALWQPILDKHRVDLVLQGHDHTYLRTVLMGGENVAAGANRRDPTGGTVYVVSVSGPKMYELEPPKEFVRRSAEDTQLYQIITVDGGTLHYEARTATGDLYDGFELRKQTGAGNVLIDQIPPTPEHHRPARAADKNAPPKQLQPPQQLQKVP